jgi:Ca2+/Na+ antiporter
MAIQFAILAVSSAVTVAAVRCLLIYGIEAICRELNLSAKTKGQVIGYATSTPELVVVVASAGLGVFDVGLWNIASSNVINCLLFILAVAAYRQHRDLFSPQFLDEAIFTAVSVALPLTLYGLGMQMNLGSAAVLLGIFVLYKWLDRVLNVGHPQDRESTTVRGGFARGLLALGLGIALILIAGYFLGSSARDLVDELKIPPWLVGWILGVITSLPELASFFEVYRLAKSRGRLEQLDDTQSALDALVASNMSNLGIILPTGIIVFYFFLLIGG